MSITDIIILGILQGITEFLPISSSAHLILYGAMFTSTEVPLMLNLAFHSGTTLSLLIYFRADWHEILRKEIFTRTPATRLGKHIILASLPIAVVGVLGKELIAEHLHTPQVVIFPLAVIGVLLWGVDRKARTTSQIAGLTYRQTFIIGLCQTLALIPGVSRSGIAMLGGRVNRLNRANSVRFAFLIGTPVMLGALALNLPDLMSYLLVPKFLLGVAVSAVSGLLAIKFLLQWIERIGFGGFAIYRILLAIAVGCWLFKGSL